MSDVIKFNTEQLSKEPEKVKLLTLVPENDPVLYEVMPEFDFSNPPTDPNELASSLVETCRTHKGLGLSANQCGLRYRVFVMGSGDNYVAFFNPKIVAASEEMSHIVEGCLSFPLLGLRITRPSGVVVEYQDFTGETKKSHFTGISARCFLHELDHMNGIVYTQRVKPLALQQGLKKRNKMIKKIRIR